MKFHMKYTKETENVLEDIFLNHRHFEEESHEKKGKG